jgi:hypothetical protein
MGFLDFLKSKKESEKEPEKLAFNDIENWFNNKEKETKNKEKQILNSINQQTQASIKELKEKLEILENFDLESRKDKDKIKAIVKENWTNYIYYVKKFIESLENLTEQNLGNFATKANRIFFDFDKKSYMNYQKATILIGKEMAAVKNHIMDLSKYLKRKFDENQETIDLSKNLTSLKTTLNQLNYINKTSSQTQEKITNLDKQATEIKEKNKKLQDEINKIKQTQEHLENLKKQENIEALKTEIDQEVIKLRDMINFKALSNVFHVVKEKHDIVKAHKEDFAKHFHKDNGASILELINETKSSDNTIQDKIKEINNKKQDIAKIQETLGKDKTQPLLLEIENINLELEKLNLEKQQELKSHERFKTKNQEIKNTIKDKLKEFDVIVVDRI